MAESSAVHAIPVFAPEEHFESLSQQAHAAKLGMGLFLASEALLFAGLFTLFAAYRAHYPAGFDEGVRDNTKVFGSVNTGVLLVSSTLVASGVHMMRRGRRKASALLVGLTVLLGIAFLVIKVVEYAHHFHEGIFPGGNGRFFLEHPTQGLAQFWTLYFVMTGLHAIHVFVGITVLTFLLARVLRGSITADFAHPLAIGAIYWHLVDLIWIFLWPLIYLA
jgi:cytochrome c oxidase subunit III